MEVDHLSDKARVDLVLVDQARGGDHQRHRGGKALVGAGKGARKRSGQGGQQREAHQRLVVLRCPALALRHEADDQACTDAGASRIWGEAAA